jgi:hypothetical protein
MSMRASLYQKVRHFSQQTCVVTDLPIRRGGAWKLVVSCFSLGSTLDWDDPNYLKGNFA